MEGAAWWRRGSLHASVYTYEVALWESEVRGSKVERDIRFFLRGAIEAKSTKKYARQEGRSEGRGKKNERKKCIHSARREGPK